jgi:prepilin-type N-terminal cleavage/methylation domain-containing protein
VVRRLRNDEGFGLVELLIAMTILTIGIMAIAAGFSSGWVALDRASKASTASAIADQKMEAYRRVRFADVVSAAGASVTGPDSRTYWVEAGVDWTCATGTYDTATATCTGGVPERPMKLVQITVRDGTATAKVLFRATSTFDQATG